jgi:hypothetical protein
MLLDTDSPLSFEYSMGDHIFGGGQKVSEIDTTMGSGKVNKQCCTRTRTLSDECEFGDMLL